MVSYYVLINYMLFYVKVLMHVFFVKCVLGFELKRHEVFDSLQGSHVIQRLVTICMFFLYRGEKNIVSMNWKLFIQKTQVKIKL